MAFDPLDSSLSLPLPVSLARERRPPDIEDEVIALFDELRAPLLRYLFSFRLEVADAEEIVQEAFLALHRHLRGGKSRANLPGWLFRVAHNLALKRRSRVLREAGEPVHMLSDGGPSAEENLLNGQRRNRLMAVVRALPRRDQYCLSLRAEGLTYRDIAEVLGMSLGAVSQSLARSIERLRRADGGK
jgi:RNA polymerase sigma-70 factor (ECF subfamily)